MKAQPHILVIEDDVSLVDALAAILVAEGYRVSSTRRGDEGCRMAMEENPDLVVTDLRLPGMGGMELVKTLRRQRPSLPVVMMTAHGTPEAVIESTKEGVFDYLGKPFEIESFLAVVRRSLQQIPGEASNLEPDIKSPSLVGRSLAMQSVYKEIGRLAKRPVTVLIRGETGTGKELVARALHTHSGRANLPFVAVNCAAISETLLESELFGHERGAFTGAIERRIGRFEQAAEGTLFLDEIGELGMSTQAKLLRVLQEGYFERVGGRHGIAFKARILAATHVNIDAALVNRTFREDLYYRLNQASILVPPLRDRPEDIPDIARHFVQLHSIRLACPQLELGNDIIRVLKAHPWPGNVRELENVMRRILIRGNGLPPTPSDVTDLIKSCSPESVRASSSLEELVQSTLDAAERGEVEDAHAILIRRVESTLLTDALARANGNQSQVARWLGISRVTLREKLRALKLLPSSD